jgi:hypothetical protein
MQPSRGTGLLFGDLELVIRLGNEARCRAVERLFGVQRDQVNIVTLIALGLAAQGAHNGLKRIAAPGVPARGDALLAADVAREVLLDIAGPAARQAPYFAGLLAFALVAHGARPMVHEVLRGARDASRHARAAFTHRYGYGATQNAFTDA